MLAMSDARDQPVIEQDGYYISPGIKNPMCFPQTNCIKLVYYFRVRQVIAHPQSGALLR
jgi:hypothetical protein